MNTSGEQLLHLLTLAIHGGEPNHKFFSSIDGEELYKLASQQNISTLLYPTLHKHAKEIKLKEQILSRWKENTLFRATRQLSMTDGIKTIFDLFLSNSIPVISLKGLALKQLYPKPDLREMGDLDLFINDKDMEAAIGLLKTLGYHPKSLHLKNPNYMHIEMVKDGSFTIELHRSLWPLHNFKNRDNQIWYKHIWENKRQLEVEGIEFTALPLEDELINMVIHIAKHIMNYGSNLRQFCDIVLFLKAYWNMLDLIYVDQAIKSMGLFSFYQYLIATCHLFLGLPIPFNESIVDINNCEILITDTLNYEMIHLTTEENECWIKLSELYFFARNNQFLIPLSFIIEIGRQFTRKRKSFLDSISYTKKSFYIFNKRIRFLRSIGLLVRL